MGRTSRAILVAIALGSALWAPGPTSAHSSREERLARIDRRIAEHPGNADLRLARSILYRDRGDFPRALADLDWAARLDPARGQVDLLRGELYLAWGRPLEAIASLQRFVAREPQSADAHAALARAWVQSGNPASAVHHFDRAIESAPVPIPAYYLERARALAAAGPTHVEEALRGLDAGMQRLGPEVALANYAVELELARGRYDAALARLDSVASSPPTVTQLMRRAEILDRAQRPREARAAYAEALDRIADLPARRRSAPAIAALELRARSACARSSP